MLPLLLISFINLFNYASAQSCAPNTPTVDLTRSPGPLALIPPMDQQDSSLCYAFTIAQLVDAKRYVDPRQRQGRISPLSLGVLTPQAGNAVVKSRLFDGGSAKTALQTLNTAGNPICDDSYMRKLYGDTNNQIEFFGTMELVFKSIREAYFKPCNDTPVQRKAKAQESINSMSAIIRNNAFMKGSPDGPIKDFLGDLTAIVVHMNKFPPSSFANYNDTLNRNLLIPFLSRACEGHTVRVPPYRFFGVQRNTNLQEAGLRPVPAANLTNVAWTNLLKPGASPIGFSFCSKMLTTNTAWMSPDNSEKVCGRHAAILAGARCVNSRRQFLVRNSWGANCGSTLAARHRPNCDRRGNVWVDADLLMKSTSSLYQVGP